jgi:prepilin-type N-terminal cleavage/methylation domain-containing protein
VRGGDTGFSLVELLFAAAVVSLTAAIAAPGTMAVVDGNRVRQAAAFAAARLRLAKQQAVSRSAYTALTFDQIGGRWTFSVCVDGNGNGFRRGEVTTGKDKCVEGPYDIGQLFPGVDVSVDGTIRGPDGDAPSTDAVRFGSSNLASFSPSGSCTAGSLFLRSARGVQFVVRIAGATGRLRVLRYDAPARVWREV